MRQTVNKENTSKIIVTGDLHGEWGHLNTLMMKKQPSMVIVCGDYGYWPRWQAEPVEPAGPGRYRRIWNQYGLKNHDTVVRFIDGNHEDHEALRELLRTGNLEIMPKVFYQPRGSTITLEDGRNVLFIGGAVSIDKQYRTEGRDWFREEVIGQGDIFRLPDIHVDIVISHTCPLELLETMLQGNSLQALDPSNAALSHVYEKYRPRLWYFAHWHTYAEGVLGDCRWYCLNMSGGRADNTGWWRWLDDLSLGKE